MKLYRCELCGNIVEKVIDAGADLMCCHSPMIELTANTSDGAGEKHVPVVEVNGNKVLVRVGEVLHPMIDVHYIQFIYVVTNMRVMRVDLVPHTLPQASFVLDENEVVLSVYEYCNIHGLWKTEL